MSAADAKHSRKQKQKESKSRPAPSGTERLKTIVRRLPPNLPEDIFWQSVQAWVTDDTVTWKLFCPGKLRTKRLNKEGISSRAYIAFKNEEQVATFSRGYDGHLFRDKAGNESQAIVEFAPFQKVPTEKKKVDARNNTIDKDEDYLSFLETLKNSQKAEPASLESLIAASQPPPPPTTTPLLEALKAERLAQKDRETILRSHAHYKDAGASGASLSKKEDTKKKAAAAAQAAKQAEPPASLSKRAKKAAAAAAFGPVAGAVVMQKAPSTQAQDVQGSSPAKDHPVAAAGASTSPSSAKLSTPTPTSGHGPRHRHPKNKGDAAPPSSVPASTSTSVPGPAPLMKSGLTSVTASVTTAETTSVSPSSTRKSRPTIGLGRQFEAALNGAGVAIVPTPGGDRERKKRDKGGGSGTGGGESGTTEGAGAGKGGKHSGGEHGHAAPSILQRPEGQPDVMIMQRPQSPRGTEASAPAGHGESGGGGPPRGGRRGRGRGRGGHRGG